MMDYADFGFWIFVSVWVIVLTGIVLEQRRRIRLASKKNLRNGDILKIFHDSGIDPDDWIKWYNDE